MYWLKLGNYSLKVLFLEQLHLYDNAVLVLYYFDDFTYDYPV